jgi:hypothetical protein
LNLSSEQPVSKFGFKCNLCHYTEAFGAKPDAVNLWWGLYRLNAVDP